MLYVSLRDEGRVCMRFTFRSVDFEQVALHDVGVGSSNQLKVWAEQKAAFL